MTAPIAIFLTLGAVEFSRAVWAQASIDHAAQETVRFASVRGAASNAIASSSQLEAMALQTADLDPAKTTANVTWNPDNLPGSVVTVQMQHTFTHINLPFTLPTIALNSTASMTIVR